MRIAALYDIHGNLPALEAVLDEVRDAHVDQIVVGGDVFPGPLSQAALARLRALDMPVHFIKGNGDRAVLALARGEDPRDVPEQYRATMKWVAAQITREEQETMAGWPPTVTLDIDGAGQVLFCHATPDNDMQIFTRATPADRLVPIFERVNAALVVCGHTHMQFDRMVGTTRVVNAGSVGMPFGDPGAYWLLLGPGVHLQRTDYDLAAAADRIRNTAYPQAEEFATRNVLQPPSEEEMLDRFARAELR